MTKSVEKQIAESLAADLPPIVNSRAEITTLWHPSYDPKRLVDQPAKLNVRPATRSAENSGRITNSEDCEIEIALTSGFPSGTSDPVDAIIDELDALAGEVFRLFVFADDEDLQPVDTKGSFTQKNYHGYCPSRQAGKGPTQTTTVDSATLESDRIFMALLTITFSRRG